MRTEQFLTSSFPFFSPQQLKLNNSAHIQGRIQIGNELKQHKLGEEPQKGSEQIRAVCKVCLASTHMPFFLIYSFFTLFVIVCSSMHNSQLGTSTD